MFFVPCTSMYMYLYVYYKYVHVFNWLNLVVLLMKGFFTSFPPENISSQLDALFHDVN